MTFYMSSSAGAAEIQLAREHVPRATCVGVLRDGRGLLLEVESAADINAQDMQKYEKQLLRAGVSEWTWAVVDKHLQIRAYWPFSTRKKAIITFFISAVFFIFCWFYYDIHVAKTPRSWFAT